MKKYDRKRGRKVIEEKYNERKFTWKEIVLNGERKKKGIKTTGKEEERKVRESKGH